MDNALKYVRCDVCRGKKIVNGLGGMPRECKTCHGVGHVALDKVVSVECEHKSKDKTKIQRAVDSDKPKS